MTAAIDQRGWRKKLRGLVGKVDTGEFVEPSAITANQWLDQWLAIGAAGRKKEPVGQRTQRLPLQPLDST